MFSFYCYYYYKVSLRNQRLPVRKWRDRSRVLGERVCCRDTEKNSVMIQCSRVIQCNTINSIIQCIMMPEWWECSITYKER